MNVLVTGASGGIGQSVCLGILKNFPNAILGVCCNTNIDALNEIEKYAPDRVIKMIFDATDSCQVSESIADFISKFSKIDIFVNCIGSMVDPKF
jgi:NADP-dependent 3-hydroxy acid dehydrogenase YdfG